MIYDEWGMCMSAYDAIASLSAPPPSTLLPFIYKLSMQIYLCCFLFKNSIDFHLIVSSRSVVLLIIIIFSSD